jgi:hypothetical protein
VSYMVIYMHWIYGCSKLCLIFWRVAFYMHIVTKVGLLEGSYIVNNYFATSVWHSGMWSHHMFPFPLSNKYEACISFCKWSPLSQPIGYYFTISCHYVSLGISCVPLQNHYNAIMFGIWAIRWPLSKYYLFIMHIKCEFARVKLDYNSP